MVCGKLKSLFFGDLLQKEKQYQKRDEKKKKKNSRGENFIWKTNCSRGQMALGLRRESCPKKKGKKKKITLVYRREKKEK